VAEWCTHRYPDGFGQFAYLSSTMQMHPWKQVLSSLAEQPVLAEWRLSSGVGFFMYTPSIERLGPDGIEGSTVQYEELTELRVPAQHQLGSLSVTNDLASTQQVTEGCCLGIDVQCTANEIRIQLKSGVT